MTAATPGLAQQLPMTREGLNSAVSQYFGGADRNSDGRLDRGETATALGYAREMLTAKRDAEPFLMDVGPDGRPRLSLNPDGPLSQGGLVDLIYRSADTSGDGLLSLGEVQTLARERFDAVDTDHDGILDDKERKEAEGQLGLLQQVMGLGVP